MSELGDKMRESRRVWIKTEGFEFQVQTPTDLELGKWHALPMDEFLGNCVIGWKFKEHELFAGGGGNVPDFDVDGFKEWLGNHIEVGVKLGEKVMELYNADVKRRKDQKKN